MKKKLLFLTLTLINLLQAQNTRMADGGGSYNFNPEHKECLTNEQRLLIKQQLNDNIALLQSEGKINKNNSVNGGNSVHPLFIWPVIKSATAPYNNVWSISNYVDHNPNYPNALQDWNCGDRTYDTNGGYNHQGIDIFTWPFSFNQMDNNHAIAVAAADGIIILKTNGNFDRSCTLNGNTWNAVYIQHSDGSQSWYGHLKNGSLTTKNVGEFIASGEYVGVVGSSGNSTGPHLHFEVYNNLSDLVDTYSGTCNAWSAQNDTWWQNQKPYLDPKINAILSHSAPPQFNSCPTSEVPNINNNFSIGSNVVLAIYLADQLANSSVNLVLKRPDNTVQYNWNFSLINQFYASWWYWTFPSSDFTQQGTYRFTATYQGNSVTHNFNYGSLAVDENVITKFSVTPNPAKDSFTIDFNDNSVIERVLLFDMLGKLVIQSNSSDNIINIAALSNGIYLVNIETEEGTFTSKIIKQ